jgi:hypothetical protein
MDCSCGFDLLTGVGQASGRRRGGLVPFVDRARSRELAQREHPPA